MIITKLSINAEKVRSLLVSKKNLYRSSRIESSETYITGAKNGIITSFSNQDTIVFNGKLYTMASFLYFLKDNRYGIDNLCETVYTSDFEASYFYIQIPSSLDLQFRKAIKITSLDVVPFKKGYIGDNLWDLCDYYVVYKEARKVPKTDTLIDYVFSHMPLLAESPYPLKLKNRVLKFEVADLDLYNSLLAKYSLVRG